MKCEVIDRQQRFALGRIRSLFVCELAFLNLDTVLFGQPAQGLRVRHVFEIHQKIHRRTSFAATEALAHISRRRYRKRRCTLVVERAQADVSGATPFERDKVADNLDDIGRIEDALYGFVVDAGHSACKNTKKKWYLYRKFSFN